MKINSLLYAAVLILVFAVNSMATPSVSTTGAVSGWQSADTGGVIKLGIGSGTPATPRLDLKPSANVAIYYTVYNTNTGYTAASFHTSGSFAYATSSIDTNIFRTGYTVGTDPTIPAMTAAPAVSWTNWTAAK